MTSARSRPRSRLPTPRLPGVLLLLLLLGAPAVWSGGPGSHAGVFGSPVPLAAQTVEPEGGVVGTALRLRRLDGVKRVLLIGAHPDDEDTSLIAALARGWGAEVAYLSLTRGEGGQNLIGPELDEGLGLVRTGELLAARELDGGIQFFSRAFDFGFTKTSQETLTLWPREEILADVTWVVRSFRPQILVSIFPPGPAAGHGQHQAAGILAEDVFDAAGDPTRFPEQLSGEGAVEPWTPLKLYRARRSDPSGASAGIETGRMDPILGRSHHQLAMESRSLHRSQDMGAPQSPGPRGSYVTLVDSRVSGGAAEGGIFAGVDTTLASAAEGLPPDLAERVRERISGYRAAVRNAADRMNAFEPAVATPALAEAVVQLRGALAVLDEAVSGRNSGTGADAARSVLQGKLELAGEALLASAGIVTEARADDDLVVPGEAFEVEVVAWNGGSRRFDVTEPEMIVPEGWDVALRSGPEGGPVAPGEMITWRLAVRVPEDAELSRPYYLEAPRDGEIYRWPEDRALWGLPRNPTVVEAALGFAFRAEPGGESEADGAVARVRRPAEYVGVDDALGEFRDPVLVAPAVSVLTRPEIMAWPLDRGDPRSVTVAVRNQAEAGFTGDLTLVAPEGWTVEPAAVPLTLDAPGQERSVTFRVRPPADAAPGFHALRASAVSEDGMTFASGFDVIEYPHIRRDLLFREAETRVSMVPVEVPEGLRIGYVMGSGDSGAEALTQMGVAVEMLGPEEVRNGDFRSLDVVVLGVRAYETRPDLVAMNQQLLEWVRDGGTLLVQYNRYEFSGAGYAPYPVIIDRPHDRVTYETAPVSILDEDSPAFTVPNRIAPSDFEGWAQERGLYFLTEWDPRYTPLLEMSDPGEDPLRGSLLVTPLGDGLWIYTGIAFFRQFPEGVPGAYRLFANLVSLDGETWRAHHGSPDGGAP